jgi:hypothetical protein
MFDRRSRFTASAWMLLIVAFSFVGGCSSDSDTNPITPGPIDQAPPLTPTGMGLGGHVASKVMLTWAANVDPDLAGYRVYVYDPDPNRGSAFRCVSGAALWRATSFTCPVADGATYSFRVTAVDTSGNESGMSDPLTFSFTSNDNVNPGTQVGGDDTERGNGPDVSGHGWFPNDNGNTQTSW